MQSGVAWRRFLAAVYVRCRAIPQTVSAESAIRGRLRRALRCRPRSLGPGCAHSSFELGKCHCKGLGFLHQTRTHERPNHLDGFVGGGEHLAGVLRSDFEGFASLAPSQGLVRSISHGQGVGPGVRPSTRA